jgi:hypothetical protein
MTIQASKILHLGPWASRASNATASRTGASSTAIAFQLAAILEAYEQDAVRLEGDASDAALRAEVSAEMDRIRGYCAAFPSLHRPSTALFVLHEEWLQALRMGDSGAGGDARHRLADIRAAHAESVASLRSQCLQRLTRHHLPDRPR